MLFGNADADSPDFDPQHVAAAPATEQDLAPNGVLQRVGKQIAQHLLQEPRVTTYGQAARNSAPAELLGDRHASDVMAHPVEQVGDRTISYHRKRTRVVWGKSVYVSVDTG